MVLKQHKPLYILNFYRESRSDRTNLEVTQWALEWLKDCGLEVAMVDSNNQHMICCIAALEYDEMHILELASKADLEYLLYVDNEYKVMRYSLNGDKKYLGLLVPTEYPIKSSYKLLGEFYEIV
jgi:hypothetical protein